MKQSLERRLLGYGPCRIQREENEYLASPMRPAMNHSPDGNAEASSQGRCAERENCSTEVIGPKAKICPRDVRDDFVALVGITADITEVLRLIFCSENVALETNTCCEV